MLRILLMLVVLEILREILKRVYDDIRLTLYINKKFKEKKTKEES